jgi:carbonic anhydrase
MGLRAALLLSRGHQSMVNVAAQMRKLETHPLLGPALASGRVHVTGLF